MSWSKIEQTYINTNNKLKLSTKNYNQKYKIKAILEVRVLIKYVPKNH